MMGDMRAALSNLRYALLPPDRLDTCGVLGGDEGARGKVYSTPTRGLPQVMMMISIVPFRGSAPYTLRKVRIWEIPGKRLIMMTS